MLTKKGKIIKLVQLSDPSSLKVLHTGRPESPCIPLGPGEPGKPSPPCNISSQVFKHTIPFCQNMSIIDARFLVQPKIDKGLSIFGSTYQIHWNLNLSGKDEKQ